MKNGKSYDIWNRDNTTNHSGLRRRKQSEKGLELTPDEQNERVNLFLLGFASIVLMNAMAVLIIVLVKVSEYEKQLVIKSNIIKRQIKGAFRSRTEVASLAIGHLSTYQNNRNLIRTAATLTSFCQYDHSVTNRS